MDKRLTVLIYRTGHTLKSRIIVYVRLSFWRKNSILYSLIQVCTIINFWGWPSYTMLIQACTIIRIQPFDQQFFCPSKSRCLQSKKLKIKLMKSQKNEANFADSRWFRSFFCFQSPPVFFLFLLFVVNRFLLFHTILLFCPILLLTFWDSSTLYYYFTLYYYYFL